MIARVLTTFSAALVLASAAFAQQAPAPLEAVGTTGTTPPAQTPAAPKSTPAAPAAAPAAAARAIADPRDYKIGPEDILDINVWKNAELSRERIPVRPDGKISHPLVDDITVAGLTTSQVKTEVTKRLAQFIDPPPEVSVVVREIHSPKVSVSGNVRMAGYFELKTSNVTVLDMIARAQGLNEFADKGNIKVIRSGQNGAIEFKYNDAINGRNGANFIVQPGDVIVVN
ncbi:MAG TPA: polysaccharide biosynthesis/export family protein [Vicinamibacterales bacterium]|jgi:polysaccharide export outer membrane protein|nr:polysaccharide biosynthesis/export family protein [Vicinamibacterales bacterium]